MFFCFASTFDVMSRERAAWVAVVPWERALPVVHEVFRDAPAISYSLAPPMVFATRSGLHDERSANKVTETGRRLVVEHPSNGGISAVHQANINEEFWGGGIVSFGSLERVTKSCLRLATTCSMPIRTNTGKRRGIGN